MSETTDLLTAELMAVFGVGDSPRAKDRREARRIADEERLKREEDRIRRIVRDELRGVSVGDREVDRNALTEQESPLSRRSIFLETFERDHHHLAAADHGESLFNGRNLIGVQLELLAAVVQRVLGHSQSPYGARAVTRYVAGTSLLAFRQLQRRAWVRRAAAIPRPSGTTREPKPVFGHPLPNPPRRGAGA